MQRMLMTTVLALFLLAKAVTAQLNPYQVKAVFLLNFSKFVAWPETSLKPMNAHSFNICVLGRDPFGVYLDLTLENTQANGHPIRAIRLQHLDQLQEQRCPILFISASEQARLSRILARTRTQAILSVSDIPAFARSGGCIELRQTDRKTSLIINQSSIERAGLRVRANLLQLAKLIRDAKP